MSNTDIIRSWKSEEYFSRTGGFEFPENPAGRIDLGDAFWNNGGETRHMVSGNPDCTFVVTCDGCSSAVTCHVDCTFVITCTVAPRC